MNLHCQQATTLTPKEMTSLSRELGTLKKSVSKIQQYDALHEEVHQLLAVINNPDSEKELVEIAKEEYDQQSNELLELESDVLNELLPEDSADVGDAIIELRPGTGGLEAGLFAMDMFKMYQNYAQDSGWQFETLSITTSDLDGLREATASIRGDSVFGKLKYEVGVHRVQRIPETEKINRVHTSTMTVAVLPEAEHVELDFNPSDVRIESKRASGAGGQHVNTTDSAIRLTHIPTGIVVSIQDERSQHKNKDKAFKILRAKLYEIQREKVKSERDENRKSQVGTGDRSERIRTYNYPQDRITDHRVGLTLHGIDNMMNGDYLDQIVEALREQEKVEILKSMFGDKN